MKILISGICGFVGSNLAYGLLDQDAALEILGFDNFTRPGSHLNQMPLRARGVNLIHADARVASDLEMLPAIDWIIDAAANPCVLAGVDSMTSSRRLVENNLYGTVNLLELAKKHRAGFILLSTSRVYAIKPLVELPVKEKDGAFAPAPNTLFPVGLSRHGIAEEFSTTPPVSLYGVSKLGSELLALEYGAAFDFKVWINRCGVLAGAGQFGRPDQGIFSFWINAYRRGEALKYIGFNGTGYQARDCFHPRDLVPLLLRQMNDRSPGKPRIVNLGGGPENTMSLAQLSDWCGAQFGKRQVESDPIPRPFDLPWIVMDSRMAKQVWDWQPETKLLSILEEIAVHAEANPRWLEISSSL